MKKDEIKLIISISVALATAYAIIYFFITNRQFEVFTAIRVVSMGLTIATFFWVFYFSIGWRLPVLNLIFYRPNINGTWSGTLVSDWQSESGETVNPKKFFIVIRQSFLRIHFTTFTDQFIGVSYSETFNLDKEKGIKNLAYLFRKDTTQNHNESLDEGATELKLIEGDQMILKGKYWSNKKTNGTIVVTFISKIHVDSFDQAVKLGE